MQGELQGPEGRGAKGVRAESIPSPQPGLGRRGSGTGVTGCPIVGPRVNGRAVSIHLIGWMPARSFRPETPMQLYISYETVPFIRERHTGEQRHTHIGPLTRDAARAAGSVMRRAVRSERRKDPRGGEPRCERHCRRTREQFRCTRARENKLPSGSNSLAAGLQPS